MQRGWMTIGGLAAALILIGSAESRAQWGSYWGGIGGGIPYIFAISERPPHFALYPPVYYRHPVAQTYGSTPFARPNWWVAPSTGGRSPWRGWQRPQVAAAEKSAPEPLLIQNPFVTSNEKQSAAGKKK